MISRPLRVPWLVEAKMWRHPSTLGPEVHPALASNEFGLFLPMALLASAYLADKRFSKVGMWPKPRRRSPKKKIGWHHIISFLRTMIRWSKLCLHMYSLHLIQMCSTWCCTSLFDGNFQTCSNLHLGVSPRYPSPPASMAGTMKPLVSGWFLPSWNVGERLARWPRCGWNDGHHYSGWYKKVGCPQCVGMRQIATPPMFEYLAG